MSDIKNKICIYDPLKELMTYYSDLKVIRKDTIAAENLSIEEKLKRRIIDGEKIGIDLDLKEAMKQYTPLEIINTLLLDGMKVVGELFGSGQMQLPFVLQSAETMKTAVAYLEPFMEKVEGMQKGTIILATVKGDVHDIGKNLVDIILTNNGYKVVNLGIKCPIETMLHAAEEYHADAIGMSGLLVKSTLIMKENLELMKQRGIGISVILGGAALTRRYVEKDLRAFYDGELAYANDAFDGLRFMERIGAQKLFPDKIVKTDSFTYENFSDLVQSEQRIFLELIDQIPDEEFERTETIGRWSVRDVISHIIGWQEMAVQRLTCLIEKRYGDFVWSPPEEDDVWNARFVLERSNQSRSALLDGLISSTSEILRLFSMLEKSEYNNPKQTVPLSDWLPDCSYAHLAKHRNKIHQWFVQNSASGSVSKIEETIEKKNSRIKSEHSGSALKSSMMLQNTQTQMADSNHQIEKNHQDKPLFMVRSDVRPIGQPPVPPFYGTKLIADIKIEKIFEFINEVALIRGQWQVRKRKRSEEEYQKQLQEEIYPVLEQWKLRAKREKLLKPAVVYGYFPCASEGDDVIIYKPKNLSETLLYDQWNTDQIHKSDLVEWRRIRFPRQNGDRYLCIADYFLSAAENNFDVIAFQIVTVGAKANEYSAELFSSNQYQDYLYFHGLSVESAEALAEYCHKIIRTELGIVHHDATDIKRLFSQGYQGSRYSFGYPACPNLEDQKILFEILRPERIGMTLTEEYQIVPEQSTSALIVHHPQAKYFIVK